MDEWDEAEEMPPPCECGNTLWWWWDEERKAHCIRCQPEPVMQAARVAAKAYLWKNTLGHETQWAIDEGRAAKAALVAAGVVEKDHNFVKEAGSARRLH